ncbi:hypothetical protein LEP1GSC074_2481 [Leptospira noguchii str. Hook]|nr:hypothetical protein LEP1GSC074_2481 [Leptospira noguchii str. Hook]
MIGSSNCFIYTYDFRFFLCQKNSRNEAFEFHKDVGNYHVLSNIQRNLILKY